MIYPQQATYKVAKQTYTKLMNVSGEWQNELLDTWAGNLEGEDLERYAEVATSMEEEIGLPQATQALRQAEDDLIAWGVAYCASHPAYTSAIAELAATKSVVMREKVCATMLKLGLFDREEVKS